MRGEARLPLTLTSQKGTPAVQVLLVWTKDVGDFGFSSEDRAFAFKVIRLVGQAAGFWEIAHLGTTALTTNQLQNKDVKPETKR